MNVEDKTTQSNLNIQTDNDKLPSEFQRFITDVDPLLEAFYCAFSGHRIIYTEQTIANLGMEEKVITKEIHIDAQSRCINEAGANYLFNSIAPLISPVVQHSKLSQTELYNLWRPKIRAIRHTLIKSYYLDNNPYELKIYRLTDIVSTILELYGVTANAKDGFKLKELTETMITSFIRRNTEQPAKREGFLDGLGKSFHM